MDTSIPKNPKSLSEMTVTECEEAQRALLYEWEIPAWENASLDLTDGTARSILMDRLNKRITKAQLDSIRREV